MLTDTSNLETLLHAVVAALGDAMSKMDSSDKKMKEMEARIGVVEAAGPKEDSGPSIDIATISNLGTARLCAALCVLLCPGAARVLPYVCCMSWCHHMSAGMS